MPTRADYRPLPRLPRRPGIWPATLALIALGALGACATTAAADDTPSGAARASQAPPANPSRWIGAWQGPGAARLRIMPAGGNGAYRLILRDANGRSHHYRADSVAQRLLFRRTGKTLAIRAAANGGGCLHVVPGGARYCRDGDGANALPLVPGAYVRVKTACAAANTADVLYFNGHALGRAGQADCRTKLVSQQGIVFHLADHCAGGYRADTTANETLSVPDDHDLAVSVDGEPTRLYRFCATGLLPPALRAQAGRTRHDD